VNNGRAEAEPLTYQDLRQTWTLFCRKQDVGGCMCVKEVKNFNRKGKRNKEKGRRHSTDPNLAFLSWGSCQTEAKRQDIV